MIVVSFRGIITSPAVRTNAGRRLRRRRSPSIPRRMVRVPFEKMHGCGNDFVVLDGRRAPIQLTPAVLRRIGDRHRGVGFDQLAADRAR